MKTIEERARILFGALELYKDVSDNLKIKAIAKAFKEQDKITRHTSIDEMNLLYQAIDNSTITCDDVTRTIMNTISV